MKISKGCQYSGKLWLCLNGVVFCILQFYISHIIFHLPKYPILQQKGSWAFQNVLERSLGERWEKWLLSSSDYLVTGWKDTNGSHRRIKDPFPKQGSFQCFLPRAGTRVDVGASAAAVEHKPCRVALAEKGEGKLRMLRILVWACSSPHPKGGGMASPSLWEKEYPLLETSGQKFKPHQTWSICSHRKFTFQRSSGFVPKMSTEICCWLQPDPGSTCKLP